MDLRSFGLGLLLLLAAFLSAPTARAVSYVASTCQICSGSGVGECETGPTMAGRGATADMSRFWSSDDGFAFAASCASTTDFGSFSAFARGSGTHNPVDGHSYINSVSRSGRAFGSNIDRLTAGSGGGLGFLRIPIHVVGGTFIEWQNGGGSASFGFSCQSYLPNSPTTLGPCGPAAARSFTGTGTFDEVLNLDLPILLGTEFEYSISFSATAGVGYLYGDVPPFTGQAQLELATLPFTGAIVLDVNKVPIPGAPISLGESGFDYAPEPTSLVGCVAAFGCLISLRRRRAASTR